MIILHGRGSNANVFGPPLLGTHTSTSQTFQSSFPHTKFIFPTASKRRAQIFNRSVIHQWFDNWSLQDPNERRELQTNGLRETSAFIHSLLREAIHEVGAKNVILGGLSQGCAAALIALLTWDGEPIAAFFGMCGWLPFRKPMEEIMCPSELDQDANTAGDLFETCEESTDKDLPDQAATYLYEELALNGTKPSMAFQHVPVFLGHGVDDEKVVVELGREAASCLRSMGANVKWTEYEGLGHWYSAEMIGDIAELLKDVGSLEHGTQADETKLPSF
ncbi:hypothetical protein G7Y79_00041g078060 [Physcia stellaris]|nr:hypothetical protein G7Y79_00041g078060 [Physcia stellaris]